MYMDCLHGQNLQVECCRRVLVYATAKANVTDSYCGAYAELSTGAGISSRVTKALMKKSG